MSIAFTVAVYLVAGVVVVVWLAGQGRLPAGVAVRGAAFVFWPAYLPMCLAPKPVDRREPGFDDLHQQIDRLPIDDVKRREYHAAVERLAGAIDLRARELDRLSRAEGRIRALGTSLGGREVVDGEVAKIATARERTTRDVARAREGVLRLVLRLELIDLEGERGDVDRELSALEEEIGRILTAKEEVEACLGR
jgi:hypothetical protein